jgi:hypothetical protein
MQEVWEEITTWCFILSQSSKRNHMAIYLSRTYQYLFWFNYLYILIINLYWMINYDLFIFFKIRYYTK